MVKIFSKEIIDCSSTWGVLSPDAESISVLVDIYTKLIHSDFIPIIHDFELNLWFKDSSFASYNSPESIGYYFVDGEGKNLNRYTLCEGVDAEKNKINNLYVEKKENTLQRLEKWNTKYRVKAENSRYYFLPLGLTGLDQAFSMVQKVVNDDFSELPESFRNEKLDYFSVNACVVWKSWLKFTKNRSKKEILKYMLYKEEFISREKYYNTNFDIRVYEKKDLIQLWRLWQNGNHLSMNSSQLTMGFGEAYDYRDFGSLERFLKNNFENKYEVGYDYG